MNSLMHEIAQMYILKQVGSSEVCLACKAKSADEGHSHFGPVPIYHVGDCFENDEKKVIIVGMAAYGWDDVIGSRSLANKHETVGIMQDVAKRFLENFFEDRSPYIAILREILEQGYGTAEEGLRRVAITNVVHCNSGQKSGDKAICRMAAHCAHSGPNFMLTKNEINILKPNRILALAGKYRNEYLKDHWELDQSIIKYKEHPSKRGLKRKEYVRDVVSFINN